MKPVGTRSAKSLSELYPLQLGTLGPWNRLLEPRGGVLVHYDGSFSDEGAWRWLRNDPRCRVSYNWLVLDDGTIVDIAPRNARAWHAGECRPSTPELAYRDANSYFYGVAFAAKPKDHVTLAAYQSMLGLVRALGVDHDWLADPWRISSHHVEAWPRGRKSDIADLQGFDLAHFRTQVCN
jgi:N-acetyl-anhydromuramyl-L-alanine amidase AmpD